MKEEIKNELKEEMEMLILKAKADILQDVADILEKRLGGGTKD